MCDQVLDAAFCNIFAHVIIDPSSGQDDLGMIAEGFCLIGQIVRINTDTVTADKTRCKRQEIPLCACSLQNGFGINIHFMEDHGQLIHEGNVNITLAVLDYLCSLCHLDGLCTVYACKCHQTVNLCYCIKCLFIHTGYDLGNGFQTMHLIAGVDTFR